MKPAKLWYLYFFLYVALGLYSAVNLFQSKLIFQLVRATILWLPAVAGMYLFISARKKFIPLFWKIYFVYYVADIVYEWFWARYYLSANAGINPFAINIVYFLEVAFLLPSVIALYLLAFRRE
ncbi:MAG: hypothetical protein PHU91_03495 [Candidatus Omnitrophica bacterium]|nr:hypothetical protein [Candidatus Omnitrophota bacterium]MDD5236704.1 hypothetical protein [Candidatus Omnitrophota bacterium]MDD5610917.1 hypothetical protein [Candidatus Omnitrophota bacterium]